MAVIKSGSTTDQLFVDAHKSAQIHDVGYEGQLTPLGYYYGHSCALTVVATAHTSTTGFVFLANPTASTVHVRVTRVTVQIVAVTALVTVTAPRITMERETFSGSAGATITLAKRKTGDSNATATFSTSAPGTNSAGAVLNNTVVPSVMTAVGSSFVVIDEWIATDYEHEIELGSGEALVWRQADNGTTSDTRRATVDVEWYEY